MKQAIEYILILPAAAVVALLIMVFILFISDIRQKYKSNEN